METGNVWLFKRGIVEHRQDVDITRKEMLRCCLIEHDVKCLLDWICKNVPFTFSGASVPAIGTHPLMDPWLLPWLQELTYLLIHLLCYFQELALETNFVIIILFTFSGAMTSALTTSVYTCWGRSSQGCQCSPSLPLLPPGYARTSCTNCTWRTPCGE